MVWILITLNILLLAGLSFLLFRTFRRPKDDPRLSRGLQLLQSKIAILEDISDRTEIQVRQLITLMDQKIKEIHQKIQLADKHIQLVKVSMEKSREVAKIFEDRIPHEEILERQTTANYIRAAKLAHKGHSVEEIMAQVPLPRAELELLLKLNKQQLMFSEDLLPEWAKEKAEEARQESLSEHLDQVEHEFEATAGPSPQKLEEALSPNFGVDNSDLRELGEKFRQACAESKQDFESHQTPESAHDEAGVHAITQEKIAVQKVKFPRLQI